LYLLTGQKSDQLAEKVTRNTPCSLTRYMVQHTNNTKMTLKLEAYLDKILLEAHPCKTYAHSAVGGALEHP